MESDNSSHLISHSLPQTQTLTFSYDQPWPIPAAIRAVPTNTAPEVVFPSASTMAVSCPDVPATSTADTAGTASPSASQDASVSIPDSAFSAGPSAEAEPSPLADVAAAATAFTKAVVCSAFVVPENGDPVFTEVGQAATAVESEDTLLEGEKQEVKGEAAVIADAYVQADAPTAPCTGVLSGGLGEDCPSGSNAGSSGQDCEASSQVIIITAAEVGNTVPFSSSLAASFSQGAEVNNPVRQASSEEQEDVEVSVEETRTELEALNATQDGEFVNQHLQSATA